MKLERRRQLVSEFLRELQKVRSWFEEQRQYLFFATSLLFVYDADLLGGGETSNFNVRVRMIDFAHVYPANGLPDSNYMEGLNNLIHIFESFHNDSANCS